MNEPDVIALGYVLALHHDSLPLWGGIAPMTFGKWRIVVMDERADILAGY